MGICGLKKNEITNEFYLKMNIPYELFILERGSQGVGVKDCF